MRENLNQNKINFRKALKTVEGDGEKIDDLTIVADIDGNKDVTATTKEAQLESKIYNVTAREDCVTWGKQITRITHVFASKRNEKETHPINI